jgi:Ca2+-binding RTX toxin-like protein
MSAQNSQGSRSRLHRAIDSLFQQLERRYLLSTAPVAFGPDLAVPVGSAGPIAASPIDAPMAGLVINPTFDSSITGDSNAATIEGTINAAIQAYEDTFTDPITVNIKFQEGGGLGGSSTFFNTVSYASYHAALTSRATTADDASALATLPSGSTNPVNGGTNVRVATANLRALGLSGGNVPLDSTITLNTSICNLDRTGVQDSNKYDLMAVTSHEIDEALSLGSALDGLHNGDAAPANIDGADLYRFDQTGARSYDSNLSTQAFFSIDGGTTDLARFNQDEGGDFGDWFSTGAHTPQIQDAFGTPGATPNLNVELRRLDVLGYSRVATATPAVTAPANQTGVEGASKAFDLGSFADADDGPWGVTVSWGDGSPNTKFFVGNDGSLGTKTHTYREEGPHVVNVAVTDFTNRSDSKAYSVSVSDPAVDATGNFALHPVEGEDSGSQTVATFTDPGGAEPVSDYSALINWGDGTTSSAGTITSLAGAFTVTGNHTYAEESAPDHPGSNPYDITVTISHDTAPDTTVHSSAIVSDPAVVPTGGFSFTATEGVPSAVQTVATFTDPGGAESVSDYSASINWGDGTPASTGTITLANGVFTVQGSHTFATGLGLPGDFGNTFCGAVPPSYNKPITVTINHEAATPASTVSSANISLTPDSVHLAGGSLIVVGDADDNNIVITPTGTNSARVKLDDAILGSFTLASGGRVIVAALTGNDNIQVAGAVRMETALYGGPGNDRLNGGAGRAIEIGCEGDDQLIGGNADDLLVGGEGSDRIIGNAGNDILVAGNVIDPATHAEDDNYDHLVAMLHGGPITAADDGAQDILTGSAGTDTFFYHFASGGVTDIVTDNAEIAFNT